MKTVVLLTALAALILAGTAFSCASHKTNNNDNNMNTESLTYFSFDHHNSMAIFYGEKYMVSKMEDGRVHVVIDEGFPEEKEFYLDDTAILGELLEIVKAYGMDKYKRDYQPRMQIFDGDSWSLYYKYDSGRSVSSGGYMEWPDNYREARKALADYFKKWREYQTGVLAIDYFRFTSKNNQGCDIEYTLQRGEQEATVTLRDTERGIDSTFTVSNDYLQKLQQTANASNLKEDMYDYHTNDPAATRCTYFVRYNTGDTIDGYTCHTQYPSHKVSAILEFFSQWLKQE